MIKRDGKVRGIGKHCGDRRGEISLLYLSNLPQTHQNASRPVSSVLSGVSPAQPEALGLSVATFWLYLAGFINFKSLLFSLSGVWMDRGRTRPFRKVWDIFFKPKRSKAWPSKFCYKEDPRLICCLICVTNETSCTLANDLAKFVYYLMFHDD